MAVAKSADVELVGAITGTQNSKAIEEWRGLIEERQMKLKLLGANDVEMVLRCKGGINSFVLDDVNPLEMHRAEYLVRILLACWPKPRCGVLTSAYNIEEVARWCSKYHNVVIHPEDAPMEALTDYVCYVTQADQYYYAMEKEGWSMPFYAA